MTPGLGRKGKFELLEELPPGAFSTVYRARDTILRREVALKVIRTSDPEDALREAELLQRLEHRYIVKVFEAGRFDGGDVYIATEYLQRGSVAEQAFVTVKRMLRIAECVLRALQAAHSQDILHRDIKPANILLGEGDTVKLSDFGLASEVGEVPSESTRFYQYLPHAAPEVLRGAEFTVYTDIYATGATLFRMLNGDAGLYDLLSEGTFREAVLEGKWPPRGLWRPDVPQGLRRIIKRSLNLEPEERFSCASEMRSALARVRADCEWTPFCLQGVAEAWKGVSSEKEYRATRTRKKTGWAVEVKSKAKHARTLRRIGRLCQSRLAEVQSERLLSKALTAIGKGDF